MKIIPAIDIIQGQCVRLVQGDYSQKTIYNGNPVDVAKMFEDNGIQFLHLVDLDGAKSNRIVNFRILESIATQTNLIVDFGGGIKTNDDIRIAFECGANQVTVGSIAYKNQELFLKWLNKFGSDKIILGADCKDKLIATQGWILRSEVDVIDYILEYQKHGIVNVICTDIAKDGMLQGPSIDLYNDIIAETSVNLIASGGITSIEDIQKLQNINCYGAIIGKAIYEQRLLLKELSKLC